jgi:hypothetical protein
MTSSACSNCGREVEVGVQNSVFVRGRWVQWRECRPCFLQAERDAAESTTRWKQRVLEKEQKRRSA